MCKMDERMNGWTKDQASLMVNNNIWIRNLSSASSNKVSEDITCTFRYFSLMNYLSASEYTYWNEIVADVEFQTHHFCMTCSR